MRRFKGQILAHAINAGGKAALRLKLDPGGIPVAGQPLLAMLPGSTTPFRTTLFPSRIHTDGFTSVEIPSPAWRVGADIDLLGPIGNGFSPPPESKRWLILNIGDSIDRLLPLIDDAVKQDLAIAVYSDADLLDLPPLVEIVTNLEDATRWADYIAVNGREPLIPRIIDLLDLRTGLQPAAVVQMLVDAHLVCGLGVCSACALQTRQGYALVCKDGPVIDLKTWMT